METICMGMVHDSWHVFTKLGAGSGRRQAALQRPTCPGVSCRAGLRRCACSRYAALKKVALRPPLRCPSPLG